MFACRNPRENYLSISQYKSVITMIELWLSFLKSVVSVSEAGARKVAILLGSDVTCSKDSKNEVWKLL